jgi:hypothetical protein
MKQLLLLISLFLVTFASAGLAADEAPRFTHARFIEGDRSMQTLIDFPDIDQDTEVTVTCTGHASAKGRLRDARCSAPNDPGLKFTMAVSRRFNSTRLTPARVSGKTEQVDFQFTVVFRKAAQIETIEVYPHNMKNVDRLGLDYLGAQRYSVHPWPARCRDFTRDDLIMEVAIVNELGVPRDFDILAANFGLSAACRDGFANHLRNGLWIPAMYNGEFVESVWANPRIKAKVPYKRQQ